MCKLLLIALLFSFGATAQTPLHKLVRKHQGGCADSDVQSFLASTGISDPTIEAALCDLVTDLKAESLWTKFIAIYPFVGGTATTHKFNLKDPDDDDASFRITFNGTWSHSSTGAGSDGSTAYANTHVNGSTTLSDFDKHFSFYYSENPAAEDTWMGGFFDGTAVFGVTPNIGGGPRWVGGLNDLADYGISSSGQTGYIIGSVSASGTSGGNLYLDGVHIVSRSSTTSLTPNLTFYFGALNELGTAKYFSNNTFSFITLGSSLTSGEAATLNTIVEAFQDAIGRGVQ